MTKLYSLSYKESRTFLFATLFIVGNVALPQLCHLMPHGGLIWLPIYFFTLIGAYKYGWRVGLLTAVASPLVNHLLFGMPAAGVLLPILIKSTLLALAASVVASRFNKVTLSLMALVVLAYQVVGSLIESAMTHSLSIGFQDFTIGLPGMALQVVGGYLFIKYVLHK